MNAHSTPPLSVGQVSAAKPGRFFRNPLVRIILALLAVAIPFLVAQRLVPLIPLGRTASSVLKALVCAAVSCGAYIAYVHRFERRKASEFGLEGAARDLLIGCVVGALLFAATIGILALLGVYRFTGSGGWHSAIVPLAVALVIGTFEEVAVRGIIFRISEESLGTWLALIVSAVVFGLLHLVSPDSTVLGALSIVIGASVLLTGAYVLTRRLWFPIAIHAAWNFTQGGVFGITVSGHPGEGLLRGTLTGPEWLSGGSFGAEASIVATLLCLGAGVLLFALAARRKGIVRPSWK